ncbi:MAG: PIN domain-containing protein [Acidobacteriaceae bacterium]|jgi:predicted nucleic acid-binding protein
MSDERYTFDTNILFYAADSAAGYRHRRALALTQDAIAHDCVLTLQSLGELSNAVAKRRIAAAAKAQQIVQAYRRSFPIIAATEADLDAALDAQQSHNISFWDAILWATARRAGCTLLVSEDFQDGRTLGGVTFRNPFVAGFKLSGL